MKDRPTRKKEVRTANGIRPVFEAITVGSGRSAEPYIIAFHYKSDNVAGKVLGTLFGFFEVEVHDEDAAYIVNFLASVAKKEYFANPRRSVEDGFETMLHKVNVALAEIAKEGNVSWLGHLHGVLGAVSDHEIFFSATGDGVLSLARDDTFRPISDGLAENLAEPHPLKTFTEVASGQLVERDVFLALSPSIWTLFTPDELKKNIARMSAPEFAQFLRTALINELPIAGAVIVRVEAVALPTPQPKKAAEAVPADASLLANVWSRQAFEQARTARLAALKEREDTDTATPAQAPEDEREEYVDRKTGHIYVQGEDDHGSEASEVWKEKLGLTLQALSRSWSAQQDKLRRNMRRARKQSGFFIEEATAFGARLGRSVSRRARSLMRRLREVRAERQRARATAQAEVVATAVATESLLTPPMPPSGNQPSWRERWMSRLHAQGAWCSEAWSSLRVRFQSSRISRPTLVLTHLGMPTLPERARSLAWIGSLTSWVARGLNTIATLLRKLASSVTALDPLHAKRQRLLIVGVTLIVIAMVLGFLFLGDRATTPGDEAESENAPAMPAADPALSAPTATTPEQDEPLATRLSDGRALTAPYNGPLIAFVRINDLAWGVTRDQIVNIATQESRPTPELIRLATAMDDLDALFLLGESGTLHMYTVANKQFETSTLPLPAGAQVDAIGAYLTYLYVLDRDSRMIYRFPRSEGGFGAPVTWSKESLSLAEDSPLTVGETIALVGEDQSIGLYERGKRSAIAFGETRASVTPSALAFDKASTDLLVLDRTKERVVRYRVDGSLVAQYFHASFKDASTLLMGPGNTLLVVRPDGTFAFQLP